MLETERIGVLITAIGIVLLVTVVLDMVLRRWRYRWIVITPVLFTIVIGFTVAVGAVGGSDSDAWFLVAAIVLGLLAMVLFTLGSIQAGRSQDLRDLPLLSLRSVASIAYVMTVSGSALYLAPEASQILWLAVPAVAVPVILGATAMAFVRRVPIDVRGKVILPVATAIPILGWIMVDLGAPVWTLYVACAVSIVLLLASFVIAGEGFAGRSSANMQSR